MKNKIFVFMIALIVTAFFNINKLSAQLTTQVYSEWIGVNSYQGSTTKEALKYLFHIQQENYYGTNKIDYDDWAMRVRVNSDIVNSEGKTIPPGKISIKLSRVSGGPRMGDLDAILDPIPLSFTNQSIIPEADKDIKSKGHYQQWIFAFDIIIEGGEYLEELKSNDSQYSLNLTFSLWDEDGRMIGNEANGSVRIQIAPTGTPPSGPQFGFEVNANATLDFTTPEHYTRQVENDLSNSWVKVTSKNSGYVIKVKTNTPNFELIRNDSGVSGDTTIPVNVVNVEMQSAGSGASQGAKPLSSTVDAQTLFIGTKNKNTQKLPVRYFIRKTEAEKLATKTSGEYKAILTYTLEPN